MSIRQTLSVGNGLQRLAATHGLGVTTPMKPAFMSQTRSRNVSRNMLHSRLQWLSRLANHANHAEQAILDARCHLIVKTIMRRMVATPQTTR